MQLKQIFPQLDLNPLGENSLSGISDDSRLVNYGDIFFIIEREHFDIFSILREVEPKVAAFVARGSLAGKLRNIVKHKPVIYVNDIQKEFIRAVDLFYEFSNHDLKIIGVTGTNGKTTTATFAYYLFEKLGIPASLISTVKYYIGSEKYRADCTTPGFLALRKLIKKAKDAGSRFLVMEVSSHAIDQQRIRGINFAACLFTNLGRDHLDYHGTIENYFKVKKKLFSDNKKAVSLINIDDPYGIKLFRALPGSLTYGTKAISNFKISKINLTNSGSSFDIAHADKEYFLKTQNLGRHNIYNFTGVFGLMVSLGFPAQVIAEEMSSFGGVEGRLELIGENIFVDYAHTPDALETVLTTLHQIGYENIICVFGCGGDRDKGKRKLMGGVAAKGADFSIITSDNPRSENPRTICRAIEKGFPTKNYKIIIDRKKALEEAVNLLAKWKKSRGGFKTRPYCLLIAGKGHEDCQIIGQENKPFKDSEMIRKIIKNGKYLN